MKSKKFLVLLLVFINYCVSLGAQGNANGVQVAQKIAKKMKDTLNLSGNQKSKIYDANMQIHNQKQAARNETPNNPTLLRTKIQAIEKTRDSLYIPILKPEEFILYKQKKRNLVSNN
jgi:outer membrane lipoprotein-sorting protein